MLNYNTKLLDIKKGKGDLISRENVMNISKPGGDSDVRISSQGLKKQLL